MKLTRAIYLTTLAVVAFGLAWVITWALVGR